MVALPLGAGPGLHGVKRSEAMHGQNVKRLFGTDGIRGVANTEPMTPEMALKLGRAAAHLFRNGTSRHRIVIGKDTRLSGYMLESALTSGICSMGVDVLLVGPLPTPGIAAVTRSLRADAGIVISASHNPYEDNGIKFFSRDGFKLPDALEHRMEEMILSGEIETIRPTASEIGKAYRVDDAIGRYIEFVKASFPRGMTLDGLKVVVDCANGAAYKVSPTVLRELGATVISVHCEPDGTNINRRCGSLHPEDMQAAVRQHGAHLGIAHDGDADRALLADEKGRLVDGDRIMALCALHLHREQRLARNTLVTTVMSNIGLTLAMHRAGIRVVTTPVGDRYVVEAMLEGGYTLGGEQSGHIVFLEHNTTGDGIITALQVLAIMQRTGKPLSELSACMTTYPQVLLSVPVREKRPLEEFPQIATRIREAENRLGKTGRVLVRYSGTESKVRVMVEGEDENLIRSMAESIAESIQSAIGPPR